MQFPIATLEETHAFLIADFANTFRADPPDVSEGSFNWLWLRTFAAGLTGNHAHTSATKTDLFPGTAEGDMLRAWAELRGVIPKTATPARKSKGLRVSGTPTTVVPAEAELVHASGLIFQTASSDVIGPGEYVDVDVVAVSTGSVTRLNAGEVLTFTTPIADIQEAAELHLDMDEDGDDAETDGDLQPRVKNRFSNPPLGGAANDYVQWAIAVTGYAAAFEYPLRRGLGTIDLAALHKGSGSARCPSEPEVAELQAVIDTKRPVSVKGFRVLLVTPEAVDVEYTVIPNGDAAYTFDWDDSTPPVVSTWDSVTRTLVFTSDRPSSMKAGDRIIVAAGDTARERVIDALDSTDGVILTLDEDGDTPAGTIYSGGPLVQPVRAAILAHFISLGTANPDATRYGAWEGNLRPNAISRVAGAVAGHLDGTVVLPAATVEASDPAYPSDETVGLLVPGRVLVRWEH